MTHKDDNIIAFPTFTIPTSRCCSLILPFADIAAVLGDQPHIVQVSIGELDKNQYQLDLDMDWLHAPAGWPVYLSGFSAANPVFPQVFLYDACKKCMQISSGPSRVSLTYSEMVALAQKAIRPRITLMALPVEKGAIIAPPCDKKKRKPADRKNQSLADAMEVMRTTNGLKFVLPEAVDSTNHGLPDHIVFEHPTTPIVNGEKTPDELFAEISAALQSGAKVVETDFPFHCAKQGWLLNKSFQLVNLRSSEWFHKHTAAAEFEPTSTPPSVVEAGLHSMSYLHHLFRCEELSGPILLATINLYQFSQFVSKFRVN